jgi:glycosyltransferase involved in cell wall biosynthesis
MMYTEKPGAALASRPRVSVCIPTYNRAGYLRLSIESVLSQSFGDWELIVADNASTDETAAVVASFTDPRIRYVRNEVNLGMTGNFNRCLELARGEFVAMLCDDDQMLSDNLARKVAVLEANPEVGFVHSNIFRIDENGEVIGEHWIEDDGQDHVESAARCFPRLFEGNFVSFPSALFRRSAVVGLGGFDPRLRFVVDWEMWLRIALHHQVAYLAQPLVRYRLHGGMESAGWSGRLREIRECRLAQEIVLHRFGERIPAAEQLRHAADWSAAKQALRLARRLCRQRLFDEARECLAFAAATFPPIMNRPRGLYVRSRVAVGERARQLLRGWSRT